MQACRRGTKLQPSEIASSKALLWESVSWHQQMWIGSKTGQNRGCLLSGCSCGWVCGKARSGILGNSENTNLVAEWSLISAVIQESCSSRRWQPNPTGEMQRPVFPRLRRFPLSRTMCFATRLTNKLRYRNFKTPYVTQGWHKSAVPALGSCLPISVCATFFLALACPKAANAQQFRKHGVAWGFSWVFKLDQWSPAGVADWMKALPAADQLGASDIGFDRSCKWQGSPWYPLV